MSNDPNSTSRLITERLQAVRSAIRAYVTVDGLLRSLIWIVVFFWLVAAFDYLPVRVGSTEMPQAARIVTLVLILGGGAALFVWHGLFRLVRRIPDSTAALLLERRYPELRSRLITSVQLSEQAPSPDVPKELYREMLQRVRGEAQNAIEGLSVGNLLKWRPLIQKGILFGILSIATISVAVSNWSWFNVCLSRIIGLSDQPWPRLAKLRVDGLEMALPSFTGQTEPRKKVLEFQNQVVAVPKGSTSQLRVAADQNAKIVPELCSLSYRLEDGQRGRTNLRRVGGGEAGWQSFVLEGPPLESVSESVVLDVFAADVRLRDLRVDVVRPAIIETLKLVCNYPGYLYDPATGRWSAETLDYRAGLQLPEGTEVVLKGNSSSKFSAIEYVLRDSGTPSEAEPAIQRLEVGSNEFELKLPPLRGNVVLECLAWDERGLPSDQVQRYLITSVADAVPLVKTRLEGIGTAVTPNAMIPIRGSIQDDHQLDSSWVELVNGEEGRHREALPVQADGNVEMTIDLQQLAEQGVLKPEPKTAIDLMVSSRDRYNLSETPHIGSGDSIKLNVVTPEQLIILLEKAELDQRVRLEQTIGELRQLVGLLQKTEGGPWGKASSVDLDDTSLLLPRPNRATFGNTAGLVSTQPPAAPTPDAERERLRDLRRQILYLQQASLQGEKSRDETAGIAAAIAQIRGELVNNRIDSEDRRERLEVRVREPLKLILEKEFPPLIEQLQKLTRSDLTPETGPEQVRVATAMTDQVLTNLQAVLANMLDIESYNEIVDMVREMLERQEQILERTKAQQKSKVLDLFKE